MSLSDQFIAEPNPPKKIWPYFQFQFFRAVPVAWLLELDVSEESIHCFGCSDEQDPEWTPLFAPADSHPNSKIILQRRSFHCTGTAALHGKGSNRAAREPDCHGLAVISRGASKRDRSWRPHLGRCGMLCGGGLRSGGRGGGGGCGARTRRKDSTKATAR